MKTLFRVNTWVTNPLFSLFSQSQLFLNKLYKSLKVLQFKKIDNLDLSTLKKICWNIGGFSKRRNPVGESWSHRLTSSGTIFCYFRNFQCWTRFTLFPRRTGINHRPGRQPWQAGQGRATEVSFFLWNMSPCHGVKRRSCHLQQRQPEQMWKVMAKWKQYWRKKSCFIFSLEKWGTATTDLGSCDVSVSALVSFLRMWDLVHRTLLSYKNFSMIIRSQEVKIGQTQAR